jgi:hypothetical protein
VIDAESGLADQLRFDPCYLKSNGDNIMYCEFRVGTYGCIVSAAFCALLGLIFACWSLQHDRIPRLTWGSYYFVALCNFIARMLLPDAHLCSHHSIVVEGICGVALYGHVIRLWNNNKQNKPDFEASTAFLCAIAACVVTFLLLVTSFALAVIDKKKYAKIEGMRDMNNKMLLISGKASTTSSDSSRALLHQQKSRAQF